MSERITRRHLLKLSASAGAVVIGSAALGKAGVSVIEALGEAAERQNQLPDYLLQARSISSSEESELSWQVIYRTQGDATIGSIARKYYPGFDNNQPFYTNKLRFANQQDIKQNTRIYAGQSFYIPDPGIPTLGFAAGEQAVLRGKKINGEYYSTQIQEIDLKNRRLKVYYYNEVLEIPLRIGEEFATDRGFRIAAVLEGISGLVPPRVVFELFQKAQ